MKDSDIGLVLSADFELATTNERLSASALESYPELSGKYALYDKLYDSVFLINESIYNFLQMFAAPVSLGSVYSELGVDAGSREQVDRFVHDLRQKDILVTESENDRLKELIAQEEELPPAEVEPERIVKVLKHTRNVWIGLVRDETRPEPYVLKKLLFPSSLNKKEREAGIREFGNETAMHGAVHDHPNIVSLYGVDPEKHEMRLEYVEGKSIRKYVKEYDPPLAVRYGIITRILDIFEHLHARGVLHGDIHSSNFLVTANHEPMLLDFDMARDISKKNARAPKVGGVYPYAPPERVSTEPMQIFNKKQTSRLAEVYQLGLVFYMLLYHELPFDGATWKDLSGSILGLAPVWKPQTPAGEAIPPEVIRVLQKALQKNPRSRFAGVREFAAAWQDAMKSARLPSGCPA